MLDFMYEYKVTDVPAMPLLIGFEEVFDSMTCILTSFKPFETTRLHKRFSLVYSYRRGLILSSQ